MAEKRIGIEMTVGCIREYGGDRVLIYPPEDSLVTRQLGFYRVTPAVTDEYGDYYVYASKEQVRGIKEGDTIEYEPSGMSSGHFVRKV